MTQPEDAGPGTTKNLVVVPHPGERAPGPVPDDVASGASVRSVLGGTMWLTVGTFGSQAFAALLYVFVARAAGPRSFGTVMMAVGVALVGADVLDFGMKLWVLASGKRADPEEIVAQHQRKVTAALLVSVVAVLAVAVVQTVLGSGLDAICLVPLILVGHLSVASGTAIAVRLGRPRAASMLTFLERFVAAVVGLALLGLGTGGVTALVVGLVAGEIASIAYQTTQLEYGRQLLAFRLSGLGGQLRRGLPFAASDLASDIIQLHVVIVGAVAGVAAAGDYAAATRLMAVFIIVTSSLSTILLPSLSASGTQAAELFRRSLWLLAATVAAGALLVAVLAPQIVHLVYGTKYGGAVAAVQTYCGVVLLVGVGQPLSAALQASGRQSLVARVEVAVLVPSALLVAVGAWRWGAAGGGAGAALMLIPVAMVYARAWRSQASRSSQPAPALGEPEVVA